MKKFLMDYVAGPRIYSVLIPGNSQIDEPASALVYSANIIEAAGKSMFNFGEGVRHFCTAISPILIPYLLYRYPTSDLLQMMKFMAIFYTVSVTLRTLGRLTNGEYRKFVYLLNSVKAEPNPSSIKQLKAYDYEVFAAPVDFKPKKRDFSWFSDPEMNDNTLAPIAEPFNTFRNVLAYWAVHSFGRRMLYPGALSIFKMLMNDMVVNNRRKYMSIQAAQRHILLSQDGNKIDSMFWDRRGKHANGDTLVICFEGNAGYYESGITGTPLPLNYSVLGWNMPGFAESTGQPFPQNIVQAAESVMQLALEKLNFQQENIVLYAWSIGGFPASWVSSKYPNLKGFILDASFDDLVPLAEARMPGFMQNLAIYTVRKYLNLPIAKNLNSYSGPITLIRRFHDEIIITNELGDEDERRSSNRANFLLIELLRQRYPSLIRNKNDESYVMNWLCCSPRDRIMLYNMDEPVLPALGKQSEMEDEARRLLLQRLCNKHFLDFEAGHNVPLDTIFFNLPTPVQQLT